MVAFDRMCHICKKLIRIKQINWCHCPIKKKLDSEDGVRFTRNIWFCNKCWEKLIKYAKDNGAFDG